MLALSPKPDLESFIQSCTHFLVIDELEHEMETRVTAISQALLSYQHQGNPSENLANFLRADSDFLGVIINLMGLSQEKFLRLLSAKRFAEGDFGTEWGIDRIQRKLQQEPTFSIAVAQLILEGSQNAFLAQQIAPFYLHQLALPDEWQELLSDPVYITNLVRQKLAGEYYDKKGEAIENLVRQQLELIHQRYGIPYTKGQVRLVDKEVDHAIPSLEDPYVLVMTSYLETTSSSQTARANEQMQMYSRVEHDNIRYGGKRVLVNFVDGSGWLARRSDLRKMLEGCHYIVNFKTLAQLEAIICKHTPEKYFSKQAKPVVQE
jgi:hypothetical protein